MVEYFVVLKKQSAKYEFQDPDDSIQKLWEIPCTGNLEKLVHEEDRLIELGVLEIVPENEPTIVVVGVACLR